MTTYIVLFAGIIACALAQNALKYEDCGSTGSINAILIEPCIELPCKFKKGTTVKIFYDVTSHQNSQVVVIDAVAVIAGIETPIPNVTRNGCATLTYGQCPIKSGQNYKGILSIPIPGVVPQSNLEIRVRVTGTEGVIACVKTHIELY